MRITESKLRRLIRSVISESLNSSEEEVLKDLEADTGVFDFDSALLYLRQGGQGQTNESFYRSRNIFESKNMLGVSGVSDLQKKIPVITDELKKHTGDLSEEDIEDLASKIQEAQKEVDYYKRKEKTAAACAMAGLTMAAVPALMILGHVIFGSGFGQQIMSYLHPGVSAAAGLAMMLGGGGMISGLEDANIDVNRAERRLNKLKDI